MEVTQDVLFERVHAILLRVLQIVPTGASLLANALSQAFPHKRQFHTQIGVYVQNLIRICDYVPSVRDVLWHLIIYHALQLDVIIIE